MNRKILFQVTAPAILIGLMLAGTCLFSAWSIHRLQANLASILSENVASLQAASELESKMRELRYHCLLYLSKPTPEGLAAIQHDEESFERALERAKWVANTREEKRYVPQIERGYRQYQHEMANLRAEVDRTQKPHTDIRQLSEMHPIRHIIEPCHELRRATKKVLDDNAQESNDVSERAWLALILLGVGGPLGGLFCGFGIIRGLTRSIAQLSVRVRDVMHRLDAPADDDRNGTAESGSRRDGLIDVASVTVAADGDLGDMDRQMQQVVRRVKEVMEQLQRQSWDMLRAEQLAALGRLAAGVAHEVRNPLMGMKLLVEAALRSRSRKPLSEEDLRVIHGEIVRLEETVQSFLAFGRLPALQRQVADLREALHHPLELVRGRARQQGVEIRLQLPEGPVLVSIDSSQLSTVLVNLFLNALDAMPHGGRLLVQLDHEDSACCLRIQDSGAGLAPETSSQLFAPFFSTKPTGTGLGLSLSRRIVEEHGGHISAGNVPGGGACFTITLPEEAGQPA